MAYCLAVRPAGGNRTWTVVDASYAMVGPVEEWLGRLLRGPAPEASADLATAGRDTQLPWAAVIDFAAFPARAETRLAGLLLAIPDVVALDLPALTSKAGYPGTSVIPAVSWLLSPALGPGPGSGKHYVPTRSQRARSVLTFFAQDTGTHNLVYANADLSKATQNREPIAFCDHWKQVSGADPKMLIMDQEVTTQAVLGELDARGVKFATLRMRPASPMNRINSLTSSDYKTITLDRPGPYNRPRVHEDPAVTLTNYPRTVRQLIVTGLGREQPTVIITNDDQIKTRALISQYARRMTIGQRLAEITGAFCADALSSTVNLDVDLDVVLCVRPGPGPARCVPEPARPRLRHPRHPPVALPNPGFAAWFERLERGIANYVSKPEKNHNRLAELGDRLTQLIDFLDPTRTLFPVSIQGTAALSVP
jgi:hypothetical protein